MVTMLTVESPDIAVDHERLVERTIGIMRASEDPLTLDDLADMAGLSPFYFARIFRSVAGIPPGEFQSALRFERAKMLLLTTSASVTDICFAVGYDSLGTFSSRFKRLVGIGPAEFRMMPEVVAGLADEPAMARDALPEAHASASVWGGVDAPDAAGGLHVYVGLFPDGIARSRPVVGQMLTQPGPFLLPNVPAGQYHLLGAALPASGNPLDHLVPGPGTRVGIGAPVIVRTGREHIHREMVLRAPKPTDPPILTALPALRLFCPNNAVATSQKRLAALAAR
ncbi:MAG TPA: helix-turn-helix transcriptional regulator [Thermomicrobiales bacterium]|nr:helix-turn-helix transcriptional regulator [Thermomicrobiales bacterium]